MKNKSAGAHNRRGRRGPVQLGGCPCPVCHSALSSARHTPGTEAVMSAAPAPPPARPRLLRRALRWTLPVLLLAAAAGVWQRERLWVWYCAERLERAADDGRGEWADRLAAVGEPAIPTLLGLLR